MSYLIDSDILIYSLKNNALVRENFLLHANSLKVISVVSYGELVFGAQRSEYVSRNMATVHKIANLFPIIDVTKSIMETYAEIKALLFTKGHPIDDMDLIIASTALVNNYTLVTNNERHFTGISGLKIANWSKK
jgi:tRNA(fMet)-specific endonuclease VapC